MLKLLKEFAVRCFHYFLYQALSYTNTDVIQTFLLGPFEHRLSSGSGSGTDAGVNGQSVSCFGVRRQRVTWSKAI